MLFDDLCPKPYKKNHYLCAVNVNWIIMKTKVIFFVLMVMVFGINAGAHEIIKGTIKSSESLYPGTEREVEVYIPDAYDGKAPACLYVGLDGILCNAPHVIDSLIAAGKMPVTIGVFLQPGVIKDSAGKVLRYNRSNEFDLTSDKFVCFLETEVLPWVEQLRTASGAPVMLKRDDGMIFGLSSGGIAAFTAAWHRPTLFSRVFSGVGTFVAMRGGNELQAIVRKSEPRPLRVFLQDGTNDVWNPLFGHWYEGNRMLATALDFAGYDARYDWSDCNHGVKRASEIFAHVMEWMWHDWPAKPKAGKTHNNLLDTMLVDDSGWRVVAQRGATQGVNINPKAYYPDNSFMVLTRANTNCLWQYILDENGDGVNGQPFYWLHSYDNSLLHVTAMAFDGSGNLWVVTNAGIQVCDQNGRVRGILMLPNGVDALSVIGITIHDKCVELVTVDDDMENIYLRNFNVNFPQLGVTPKSQGQG